MKSICQKIIGIVLIIILMVSTNVTLAVTEKEIDEQNKKQGEYNKKIDEKEKEKDEVEKEKSDALKDVDALNKQINQYESQIDNLEVQIVEANQKIQEAEEKLKKAQEDYDKQQDMIEQRMVAVYEAGETSYLDVLLSSESLTDFISNYYIVSEVTQYDVELLEKIQKQKEEIENAKTQIENNKNELTTAKSSKEEVNNQLKTAKAEKDKKVLNLSNAEKALQQEIEELKQHEINVKKTIDRLKEEYDKQNKPINNNSTNNSSGNGSSNGGTSTSSYGFGWPVSNHSIGTSYGVAGPYWSSGYHTGIDFPVSTGTQVYSVGNGQVFDTGYNSAYGNFVQIYHGNNVYSFYAHASSVQVSIGQKVTKGQPIMLSGATGNVSGPHLHFEIRTPGYKYANCVNPRPYLP